jgi:hypothetical protein
MVTLTEIAADAGVFTGTLPIARPMAPECFASRR